MNHSSRSEIGSISGVNRQTEGLNASSETAVLLLLYRYCVVVAGSAAAAVARCCCCCLLDAAAAVFLHLTAEGENREREESQGEESN